MTAALAVDRLSKSFGPTRALHDVSLAVGPGRVHGLVGGNGSGKSTLIKILAGVHRGDSGGADRVGGETLAAERSRPRRSTRRGLRFVHQDLGGVRGAVRRRKPRARQRERLSRRAVAGSPGARCARAPKGCCGASRSRPARPTGSPPCARRSAPWWRSHGRCRTVASRARPRRADRLAARARGRARCCSRSGATRRRASDPLRQPSSRRGAGARRRCHGPARRAPVLTRPTVGLSTTTSSPRSSGAP